MKEPSRKYQTTREDDISYNDCHIFYIETGWAMSALFISGSTSLHSKTDIVLNILQQELAEQGLASERISPRDFEPSALINLNFSDAAIIRFQQKVQQAQVIVIGTPIYQASFSGSLKLLLDLIPERGLHHKIVLALATAGSDSHLLVPDYTLKPIFSALGATHLLRSLYVNSREITVTPTGEYLIPDPIRERLQESAAQIIAALDPTPSAHLAPDGITSQPWQPAIGLNKPPIHNPTVELQR